MHTKSPQHYGSALVAAIFKKATKPQGGLRPSDAPDNERPVQVRREVASGETAEKYSGTCLNRCSPRLIGSAAQ